MVSKGFNQLKEPLNTERKHAINLKIENPVVG